MGLSWFAYGIRWGLVCVWLFMALVSAGSPARAARTIQVPGDYPTIAAALQAAQTGDTVRVGAGTYAEGPLTLPEGVSLLGTGWQSTAIVGNGVGSVLDAFPNSRVEGFTLRGSDPRAFGLILWGTPMPSSPPGTFSSVVARGNRITGDSAGILADCLDPAVCRVTIEHNILDHNSHDGIAGVLHSPDFKPSVLVVRNNTIAHNQGIGLVLDHSASVAENNLIVANTAEGVSAAAGASVRANNVWSNARDDLGTGPTAQTFSFDPMFRDGAHGDYRLAAGSPAIGRGTPAGTDLGALPFRALGEPPVGVTIQPTAESTWTLSWAGNGAAGYDIYLGAQPGFYSRRLAVGSATSYALSDLPGNLTYSLAVSAANASGDESRVSAEVNLFVPQTAMGTYQESSLGVLLSGAWSQVADSQAAAGGYALSQTPGASAQFLFAGESLVLSRQVGPDGGLARVTIDGRDYGVLSFAFPEPRWQVPAIFDQLGSGAHRLTLTVVDNPDRPGGRVSLDAFTIPSPYTPTLAQQMAVKRVNYYRGLAGLPRAQGVQAIHQGAQHHVEFLANNQQDPRLAGLGFHIEPEGLPGFVGRGPSARAGLFGYTGGVGEGGHFFGDPVGSVDDWMATIYHRGLVLCYDCTDLGYGLVHDARGRYDALNMGSRSSQAVPKRLLYTYPADQQTAVPPSWGGGEIPDPLPGQPRPVGYPISLSLVQPSPASAGGTSPQQGPGQVRAQPAAASWAVTTTELRDPNGQLVPVFVLDRNSDANRYLGPDEVFLVSQVLLATSTTYTAHVAGVDSRGAAFDHRWSFTTHAEPNPDPPVTPTTYLPLALK